MQANSNKITITALIRIKSAIDKFKKVSQLLIYTRLNIFTIPFKLVWFYLKQRNNIKVFKHHLIFHFPHRLVPLLKVTSVCTPICLTWF